jgi:hypothetical protein
MTHNEKSRTGNRRSVGTYHLPLQGEQQAQQINQHFSMQQADYKSHHEMYEALADFHQTIKRSCPRWWKMLQPDMQHTECWRLIQFTLATNTIYTQSQIKPPYATQYSVYTLYYINLHNMFRPLMVAILRCNYNYI